MHPSDLSSYQVAMAAHAAIPMGLSWPKGAAPRLRQNAMIDALRAWTREREANPRIAMDRLPGEEAQAGNPCRRRLLQPAQTERCDGYCCYDVQKLGSQTGLRLRPRAAESIGLFVSSLISWRMLRWFVRQAVICVTNGNIGTSVTYGLNERAARHRREARTPVQTESPGGVA